MTLLLLLSIADRLQGQWYMILLVIFWFAFCKINICLPFLGTYLISLWYASSKFKLCYTRRCNYRVYPYYDLLICYLVMDTDDFYMGSSITYLEVCERLSFRGVTCTVISKIKDSYCCPCVGRFSRMASNRICCSFSIWFLIRNNIISHWADFLSYCSDFVRREPFVWGVWLPIAGVSARVGFDIWTVISFFFPISCFTLLWFENVFSNGILFKLNCFMAKCLYIGFLLEGSLSSICCQFL